MTASLSFHEGTLLLDGLSPEKLSNIFDRSIWTKDERVDRFRTDAIHYRDVSTILREKLGDNFSDRVQKPAEIHWPKANLHKPRSEQSKAIAAWLDGGKRGLVVMPTGTGKTEVALHIMAQLGVATLVVSPVRDLMYQWHRRIRDGLGVDAGIIGDQLYKVSPVTVTTYHSAAIHMDKIGEQFGLLVFDEAHHLPTDFFQDAALMSTASFRLGLTATPERQDGNHADLDSLIGPEVHRQKLKDSKHLARFDVVHIQVHLSDEEREKYDAASDAIRFWFYEKQKEKKGYDRKDLLSEANECIEARRIKKLMCLKDSIEDRATEKIRVLEDIFRLHPNERVLVFTGTNIMAFEISRRFLAPTILSHTKKKERQAVLEGFESGDFPVLIANQVLDEGVDVPDAKVAVVVGGKASVRQATQRLGRLLRPKGASKAILYEVVCGDTREVMQSRKRRKGDAYERTRHRRI
mgnify:CR=1 FL=1